MLTVLREAHSRGRTLAGPATPYRIFDALDWTPQMSYILTQAGSWIASRIKSQYDDSGVNADAPLDGLPVQALHSLAKRGVRCADGLTPSSIFASELNNASGA
jgi:hypothetical protein